MTETILANSAPPDKDTTLEVTEGVMPSPVTCAATAQVMVAAIDDHHLELALALAEDLRGVEAREPATDDDHSLALTLAHSGSAPA